MNALILKITVSVSTRTLLKYKRTSYELQEKAEKTTQEPQLRRNMMKSRIAHSQTTKPTLGHYTFAQIWSLPTDGAGLAGNEAVRYAT